MDDIILNKKESIERCIKQIRSPWRLLKKELGGSAAMTLLIHHGLDGVHHIRIGQGHDVPDILLVGDGTQHPAHDFT